MGLAKAKSIKAWVTVALESPATAECHDFLQSFSLMFLKLSKAVVSFEKLISSILELPEGQSSHLNTRPILFTN